MELNLNLMRAFYMVAETKSFSEAARRLHVTQPAVSKAVRELENQLEMPLLERGAAGLKSSRGIYLTDNGQALYEHARAIYALERGAVEDIKARIGLQKGRLSVGASTTVAAYWLPHVLSRFLQVHPDIDVNIWSGNTQTIAEALLDCRVDLALVEGSISDNRIVSTPWREDTLQIVTPPDSPLVLLKRLSIKQLNQQTWLQREAGSGTRETTDGVMDKLGISPAHRVEIATNEGIARTVAAGAGIAILPTSVVRELHQLQQVAYVSLPNQVPLTRPLFSLQLKERPLSPLAKAFQQVMETTRFPAD